MTRRAFTLVELLVAMAIIAILAALLLGVAARAGETAREARTKQLVARIHTLLMEQYESYRNQRVELLEYTNLDARKLVLTINGGYAGIGPIQPEDPRMLIYHRLAAVRELMKMEMPDRWSDVLLRQLPTSTSDPIPNPLFVEARTSLNRLYLRRFEEIRSQPITTILENQGAECLYLTVMNATADGEARSLFNEDDIGDTDGDGAPEFLDGWGNPISWLRWAPGYDSDAQLSYASLTRTLNRTPPPDRPFGASGVVSEISGDHDPLDLFRVDKPVTVSFGTQLMGARGWRLLPLIYSAGPDEETGIRDDVATGPAYVARVDPFADIDGMTAENQWLGEPADENRVPNAGEEIDTIADNITNHLITAR